MALKFYYHPLASFCHKVMIALYENEIPFDPVIVDFGDPRSTADFKAVWPIAKMPVLVDEERGATVAESTIVIEYLDAFRPGPIRLIPKDPDAAWRVRFWDRFFDHYVHHPMQKIVGESLRPSDSGDPFGVDQARTQLVQSYDYLEGMLTPGEWVAGEDFTMADCAAAPALFYANIVLPFSEAHRSLRAYLARLMRRSSFARALEEAEPYFDMYPLTPKPTRVPPSA
jgi:glutathione S-transferase